MSDMEHDFDNIKRGAVIEPGYVACITRHDRILLDGHYYSTDEVRAALTRPAGGSERLREALRLMTQAAYPVAKEIDPRGYSWSTAYLDEALPIALAALASPQGAEQWQEGFDFAAHLQRQRNWSERTFGPGARTAGVTDHIRKELNEVEADPTDSAEWIDVVILALDGAWRSGLTPQGIIDGITSKQAKNEKRQWPDWRTADPNKAIEHDRSAEATPNPAQAASQGDAVAALLEAAKVVEATCVRHDGMDALAFRQLRSAIERFASPPGVQAAQVSDWIALADKIEARAREWGGPTYDHGIAWAKEIRALAQSGSAAHGGEDAVRQAALGLREAQRAYMADRGNEVKGKAVAAAAERLDAALGVSVAEDA